MSHKYTRDTKDTNSADISAGLTILRWTVILFLLFYGDPDIHTVIIRLLMALSGNVELYP